MSKLKLTNLEKSWVLYDVGNSAFTLLVSTLFPIYFNAISSQAGLSQVQYMAYWGYATSIVTVIVADSFKRLVKTLVNIKNEKSVFLFLLAFFCYIDGVYTIIDMATAYGTALGLDSTGLLLALLVTQIVAFPSALIFGRLSQKYESGRLIPICIAAYTVIAIFAFFLDSQWKFWVLAICVGMFQGGIQALSRSHFAKIIPAEKSGEYFGLYDICGKGASFIGTMLVSAASQLTGSANIGVGSLVILFIAGFVLFNKSLGRDMEGKTINAEYTGVVTASKK